MTGTTIMMAYSAFTIIYIGLIILSAFAITFYVRQGSTILGLDTNKAIKVIAISTIVYCAFTALVYDNIGDIWNNFVFAICVVGAIILSVIAGSAMTRATKQEINTQDIESALNNLKAKREKIDIEIKNLEKIIPSYDKNPQLHVKTTAATCELKALASKYDELISELTIQKVLNEARIDSDTISGLQIVNSKSVRAKFQENVDKYDSSRELEDTLNDVRQLMGQYK